VPGAQASAWVVVVRGEVAVRLEPGTGAAEVAIAAGQGVGVLAGVPIPEPMDVDVPAVETWLAAVAAGSAETSLGAVALQCRVTVGATLLLEPALDSAASDTTVAAGDLVRVLGRNEDAAWATVARSGNDDAGWIQASALACNGPVSAAPPGEASEPTATVAPPTAARTMIVVTATAPAATFTPTPTGTATMSAAVIDFWVDDNEIDYGDCTDLHWRTANIDSVFLDGDGVVGEGSREVCPRSTTSYTLRVKKRDGTEERRTVEVEVRGRPSATPEPATPTEVITLPTETPTP
jgi:hypothetical protein